MTAADPSASLPTPPAPPAAAVPPARPISRTQVERAATAALAGFGLLVGGQTVPIVLAQARHLNLPVTVVVAVLLAACLIGMAVLAALNRSVRPPAGGFAVVYLVALAAWPLLVTDPAQGVEARPWLWYLCNVATTGAAIAFATWPAAAFAVVVPVLYGIVRLTPAGGAASLESVALDVVYALVLGGVLLVLITLLRTAASDVDLAQGAALARYSTAVRQHAADIERLEVDALVHDSVLTTLLSAAGARTDEQRRIAARMASMAIRHLSDAGEPDGAEDASETGIVALGRRLRDAADALPVSFGVSVAGDPGTALPGTVAESMIGAAVQAMTNSSQHAGANVRRRVEVRGTADGRTRIDVVDDGRGFDLETATSERIGIRVSIFDRVRRVGGETTITSAPGEGTRVSLSWSPAATAATFTPPLGMSRVSDPGGDGS